ncbi:hypothetical protein FB451DRAFT_1195596 [Mycena latifolia]|nr:hypothetical protein FB451DRAFT_1195596 [Mycena latifolia]
MNVAAARNCTKNEKQCFTGIAASGDTLLMTLSESLRLDKKYTVTPESAVGRELERNTRDKFPYGDITWLVGPPSRTDFQKPTPVPSFTDRHPLGTTTELRKLPSACADDVWKTALMLLHYSYTPEPTFTAVHEEKVKIQTFCQERSMPTSRRPGFVESFGSLGVVCPLESIDRTPLTRLPSSPLACRIPPKAPGFVPFFDPSLCPPPASAAIDYRLQVAPSLAKVADYDEEIMFRPYWTEWSPIAPLSNITPMDASAFMHLSDIRTLNHYASSGTMDEGRVFRVLVQHSDCWKTVKIWLNSPEAFKHLALAKGIPLSSHRRENMPADCDFFESAPRLTALTLGEPIAAALPQLSHYYVVTELAFYRLFIPYDHETHNFPSFIADLDTYKLTFLLQAFLAFVPRLSLYETLKSFKIANIAVMPYLEELNFSDSTHSIYWPHSNNPTGVELPAMRLIDNDLFRGLMWTAGAALVPRLHTFDCTTYMQFEDDIYLSFIRPAWARDALLDFLVPLSEQ